MKWKHDPSAVGVLYFNLAAAPINLDEPKPL